MKKIITFLFIALLPLYMLAQGVTIQISGTVTSTNTGQGVANHPVTIMTDSVMGSTFFYYNVVYTDFAGNYTDFVLVPNIGLTIFNIYTADCQNAYQMATVVYQGGTMLPVVNFQICTTTPACSAGFFAVPDSANPSGVLGVYFMDVSQGNPISWAWTFGDGSNGTGQYPYHIYSQPGTYQVCLTIVTANGCTDQFCQSVVVGSVFPQCQAAFSWYADSNAVNSVSFWDLSLGNINSWYWSFGDGTTSTLQNPNHQYAQNGVYNVCLVVAGANNCTSIFCDSIWVGNNPVPCQNYFSYGAQGLNVAFYGTAFGGTAPYTYQWNFGDGGVSNNAYAMHTYAAGGTYTVTLTTTDASGCTYTTTQQIFVSAINPSWISGQVFANGQYADYGWVYMYSANPGTNFMYLVDSSYIDSSGFYYFNNVPNGLYYLLAALMPGSMYYGQYMPTYYTSSIFWSGATPIILGQPANPYNINLVPVIGPNVGPGNINGTITTGNKFTTSGVPVPNVEIILLDMSNQPLAMTYSNAAGQFSFASLAFGTYKIYAEVPGLGCVPAVISLSQAVPAVTNVGMTVTPNGITTAIAEPKETGIDRMYPNPAKDKLTLELYSAKSEEITIIMVDILGNKVLKQVAQLSSGKTRIDLNTSDLNPGSYTLQTIHATGEKLVRKVNIIR